MKKYTKLEKESDAFLESKESRVEPETKKYIPNKRNWFAVRIFLAFMFLLLQAISLYGLISMGIQQFQTKPKNTFECTVSNTTLDISKNSEGRDIYFEMTWNIYYFKENDRGNNLIHRETTQMKEENHWINEYKINNTYPCTRVWKNDGTFYFEWTEYVVDPLPFFMIMLVLTFGVFISQVSFVVIVIRQWKKTNIV